MNKKNIEIIYRNANQMKYLIDELLSFSKIEMNQEKINVRKGNIMLFLKELSNIFEIVARDREIDFIVKLDDTDEEVWFSPSKLERIMYNLLSNAFKYTAPGDYVQLTASLQEEDQQTFVHISVKDSGRGIPDGVKDRIFEPYYQVSPKDHREGFGLGLSLTKSLIQLHRGRIEIESKWERDRTSSLFLTYRSRLMKLLKDGRTALRWPKYRSIICASKKRWKYFPIN